jgi:hypothetical protein
MRRRVPQSFNFHQCCSKNRKSISKSFVIDWVTTVCNRIAAHQTSVSSAWWSDCATGNTVQLTIWNLISFCTTYCKPLVYKISPRVIVFSHEHLTRPMTKSDNKSLLTASCLLTCGSLDKLLTVCVLNVMFINIRLDVKVTFTALMALFYWLTEIFWTIIYVKYLPLK